MKSLLRRLYQHGNENHTEAIESYFYMDRNPIYSKYSIGRFTYGEPIVMEWGEGAGLKIGSFCSIADGVKIFLGGNHRIDWITTFPFNKIFDEFKEIQGHPSTKGDVVIGNDVWIGSEASILSGITISDGAVIAARSVVTKDVEPYSIVGGNPARKIKDRFSIEVAEKLLKIQWWNWDIEKIKANVPLMLSTEIERFLEENFSAKATD